MSESSNRIIVAAPEDLYDRSYADELSERVLALLSSGVDEVVINFGNCESISAYGLSQLLKCSESCKKKGIKLSLQNVRAEIKEMLTALLFNDVLNVT